MKLKHFICILTFVVSVASNAQDTIHFPDRNLAAGHFQSYHASESVSVDVPDGYEPFYISHFSRHGSRYHSSEKYYKAPYSFLKDAHDQGVLTEKGEQMFRIVSTIMEDADRKWGDLTPRGAREHRQIAQRMYDRFPAVFDTGDGSEKTVNSVSTMVMRCALSMAAFNEGLKERNPELCMVRTASESNLGYMYVRTEGKAQYRAAKKISDSLKLAWISPDRFMSSIITDQDFIRSQKKEPEFLMFDFYLVASILQDVDYLGLSLWDYFTDDELYDLWRNENAFSYLTMGPSADLGEKVLSDARPMLEDIISKASDVISGRRNVAADLRFGHDCTLIPLLSLMGVQGASGLYEVDDIASHWNISEISTMAGNLQFIFFRNKKSRVKVRVLLNERDAVLPLKGFPYYDWKDMKSSFEEKCRNLGID